MVGGVGGDLVALLIPSVHTLIDDGGVKYVRNNNNNNNETICKPVVIVVTQTCAKGLCMYLNVRFRGLFSEHCFSVVFFFLIFSLTVLGATGVRCELYSEGLHIPSFLDF